MQRSTMIYLDNAATTYPKPPAVFTAMHRCMNEFGGNPGRGSHKLSLLASECVYNCRERVADFFGVSDPMNVSFTLNTTYALNTAIKSLAERGAHFIIGNFEHNSVRRPVECLARQGVIDYDVLDVRGTKEDVICHLRKIVRPTTRAVICAHASNICNILAPIQEIGTFCREHGIAFILDAAQSAGIYAIDLQNSSIDFLCVPGHKGLYGPQGCGIMIVSERFFGSKTLIEGGSGVHSLDVEMPQEMPDHFEAGTLPTPAIAGLCEGVKWVESIGVQTIHKHECALWRQAYADMASMREVIVYDDTPGSILLFNVDGCSPSYISSELNRAGICVRAGMHCAPMAHSALETGGDGAVRVSFGAMNTMKEVRTFVDALHHLIRTES